ncbi:hypothetical protein DUNSADRAFT_6531 [Dunaliella salina]|uniref:CBS domain-containing protein n=1 Tax=Dunaliella salina TaxID=3046 RepID=A0ABQ7GN88_DUNSA|nr:hypothetical protein DUNSADRAFT_6531 [Dunaliella salina]|eukprot:KAF5836061.1 hypothetical protein DUNSADRAFT_6531 [Dunaliella salina]
MLASTYHLHTSSSPRLGNFGTNKTSTCFVRSPKEFHGRQLFHFRQQRLFCTTSKELLEEARQPATLEQQVGPHANGNVAPTSSEIATSRPNENRPTILQECKFGGVAKVMRPYEKGLIKCTPGDTLEGIIPSLTQITGMPVINDARRVVGIISKKDVLRVRKKGGSLQQPVSQAMTSPVHTVPITASVQEAADLMMDKKVRPLPVVDEDGVLVGIVARSDIFRPLFKDQYLDFMSREQDRGRGTVCYVDISSHDYDPSRNMGVTYEDAMDTIHAIRSSGEVLKGTDALKALFNAVGLAWVVKLADLPIIAGLVDLLYNNLAANRLSMGSFGDAIVAVLVQALSLLPNFQPSFHGFGLLLFWKRAQCKTPKDTDSRR